MVHFQDIDEIDDNLFKSNLKSGSKSDGAKTSGPDKKDAKRQVTFSEKPSPGKQKKEDNDDDGKYYLQFFPIFIPSITFLLPPRKAYQDTSKQNKARMHREPRTQKRKQ